MDLSPWSIDELQAGAEKARASGRDDVADYFESEIISRQPDHDGIPLEQPTGAVDAEQSRGAAGDFAGGLARGVARTLMLPADVLVTAGNLGIDLANRAGADIDYLNKPSDVVIPALQDAGIGTGAERGAAGVAGEVLGGGAVPGMGAIGEAGKIGSSMLRQGVREAASNVGSAAGAAGATQLAPNSTAAEFLGALVGGVAPQGMASVGRMASMDMLPAAERQANMAAFNRQGMGDHATVGAIAGESALESASKKYPGGYGRAAQAEKDAAQAMQERVHDVTTDAAGGLPLSVDQAGATIQSGIQRYGDEFKAEGRRRYDQLYDAIEEALPVVPTANVESELADMSKGGFFEDIVDSPMAKRLLDKFTEPGGTGPTFGDLKDLRTWIGNKMQTPAQTGPVPTFDQRDLRRLYGAITQDLKEAANVAGVRPLFDDTNQFWSEGRELLDRYLNKLTAERMNPESAFKRVQSGIEAGPTMPEKVLGALTPAERGHVIGTVVDQFGVPVNSKMTPDNTFSNETFSTQLQRSNRKGGLDAALDMTDGPMQGHVKDLEIISGRGKDVNAFGENRSGTAQGLNQTMLPATAIGGGATLAATGHPGAAATMLATVAGSAAGAAAVQRISRNPIAVKWAAEFQELPKSQYQAHFARLANIINSEDNSKTKFDLIKWKQALEKQLKERQQ